MADNPGTNIYPTNVCAPQVQQTDVPQQVVIPCGTGVYSGGAVGYAGATYTLGANGCGAPLTSGQVVNYQTTQLQAPPAALPDSIPATIVDFGWVGTIAPTAPTVSTVDEALLWLETEIINRFRHDLLVAAGLNSIPIITTAGELAYQTFEDIFATAIAWTGDPQILVWDGNAIVPTDYAEPATDFLSLADTPMAFMPGSPVVANAAGTALEFAVGSCIPPCAPAGSRNLVLTIDASGAMGWQQLAPGILAQSSFLSLSDTPSIYVNQAGKYVTVNEDETAVIFSDAPQGTVPVPTAVGQILVSTDVDICGNESSYVWQDACSHIFVCPPNATGYVLKTVDALGTVEWVEDADDDTAVSSFLELTDTPSTYTAGATLVVNEAGDGVEFQDCPAIPCPPDDDGSVSYFTRATGGVVEWASVNSILEGAVFFRARNYVDQDVAGGVNDPAGHTIQMFQTNTPPVDTNFNTLNSHYIIPEDGRYLVSASAYIQAAIENNHGGTDGKFGITLNILVAKGSGGDVFADDVYSRISELSFDADGRTNHATLSGSTYLQLSAGNEVYLNVNSSPIGTNDAGFAADFAAQTYTISTSGVTQIAIQQVVGF